MKNGHGGVRETIVNAAVNGKNHESMLRCADAREKHANICFGKPDQGHQFVIDTIREEVDRYRCWEEQKELLCGLHAVNSVLCAFGLEKTNRDVCHRIARESVDVGFSDESDLNPFGNYLALDLINVLRTYEGLKINIFSRLFPFMWMIMKPTL